MKCGITPAAVLLSALTAGVTVGCGTISSRQKQSPDWDTRVYGGVASDAGELGDAFRADGGIGFLVAPLLLLDMPLSFVADTLLLPKTIPEQFGERRKEVKAFVAAIDAGDLAGAQEVARRTPEVLSARVRESDTPLHVAVERGHPDLVDWLAEDAAKDNARNASGVTPLGLGAKAARLDLARMLLDHGADPNVVSAGESALHLAAALDDRALAALLVERGASTKATARWKQTPLHVAASHNRSAVAELLLSNGADAGARDTDGLTPLHLAARTGGVEVTCVLLSRGADVNARSWRRVGEPLGTRGAGDTPLGEALRNKHAEMATLLRDKGGME